MAKGIDTDLIRKRYQSLTDQELLWTLSHNAEGLTPEAVQIVKEEIAFRRLDARLGDAVEAQNKSYTVEELDYYCNQVAAVPCPYCNKTDAPLTAAFSSLTISFIIMTHSRKELHIACPKCLRSENNTAFGLSLVLGWWGIPHGPIRTIGSIANYFRSRGDIRQQPNDVMRAFVHERINLFSTYRDNMEVITEIVRRIKNKESAWLEDFMEVDLV